MLLENPVSRQHPLSGNLLLQQAGARRSPPATLRRSRSEIVIRSRGRGSNQ